MDSAGRSAPERDAFVPAWLRNRWGALVGAAGVYVLLYAAWTLFHWGEPGWVKFIADAGALPVSLFAAAAAAHVATDRDLSPRLRRAWVILGAAIFSQFIADSAWLYLEIVLGQAPFGSVVDVFYLCFYPLALAGLLSLPSAPLTRHERLKFGLDLAVVMVAAWMAVWYFVISPAALAHERDLLAQIVAAAYPIGDLVVLGGIVDLLFRRPEPETRSTLLLFLAGLVCYITADLLYGYTSLTGSYATGGWIDLGWILAYLLFGLAALRQPYRSSGSAAEQWTQRLMDRSSLILPFVAIGLGYGLVIVVPDRDVAAELRMQGLFAGVALLTVSVTARQAVALHENLQLNAKLRGLSGDLERRVEQRTQELQEAQDALFASQKLASVGTLAAGIAHEVGSPLSTMVLAADSLQRDLDAGDVDVARLALYARTLGRAGEQASRIVQALRTYARGPALELVPQNPAEVVQDALLLLSYQIKGWRGVKVVTEIAEKLPPVCCDRNQIAQVLINLLTNARDALPGGGTITVRVARVEGGVAIEVADNGIGIAPETLDRIFAPFYTTKDIGKGTGLGLSIVTSIVRAHGGTVTARSAGPGQGATFTVTLPENKT